MATPLTDKPEIDAVGHLGEPYARSTTTRSDELVRPIVAGHRHRFMNVDHSVPR